MIEALVALSIDDTPSYGLLARRCVDSIRSAGCELPILILTSPGAELGSPFVDVTIQEFERSSHPSIYLETWFRLATLRADRLLVLDVDTIATQPLERLFDRYAERDVYGREELGAGRGAPTQIGSRIVPRQIRWPSYLEQKAAAGIADLPLLNTGVMLFNHGTIAAIQPHLDLLRTVYDGWQTGSTDYPSSNWHIAEELATSMMLGAVPHLRLGLFEPRDVPFYVEIRAGAARDGVVTHVWTSLYRLLLHEQGLFDELGMYDEARLHDVEHLVQRVRDRPQGMEAG